MGARGKTLVPLLVVVMAAAVALQSTYLQVEPVDTEKPGELLWGYCCGTGGSEGRWGEGEVLLIILSLPPRTAGTRTTLR